MRWVWGWTAVSCLVVVSPARAGDGERLAPDQLPPNVANRIREAFGAEPLHGRRVAEGGKACYIVTATDKGQVIEIFASPNGAVLARKQAFSLARWPDHLADSALFLLLPGLVAGTVARAVFRTAQDGTYSVGGWLSAWVAAGFGISVVVFNLATVPREKDVLVLGAYCIVWGAIAASAIEVFVLAVRPGKDRVARRRWVIRCCIVAAVSLALTIPIDILRIERENRYSEKLTLRPTAN
jgi:hypothetical protein